MFVYSFSVFVFLKDFAEQIENRLALNFKNFVFRLAALSLGVYLIHPMVLEYMFTSDNWMNETSDLMWVNRPRFSTEFAAEAQMHRRPITGSFERFDKSRQPSLMGYLRLVVMRMGTWDWTTEGSALLVLVFSLYFSF